MTNKKRHSVIYGVGFLAITSFVAKIIGAIYRIPLTNILGVEGIGQYQLVFPLYALLIAVVCSGAPTAIARIVASDCSLEQTSHLKNFIKSCAITLTISAFIAAIFCFFFASILSQLQNNIDLRLCYYVIAPSIIFVSISHMLKGWFVGRNNMLPTSISNLLEQLLKLIIGLLFAQYFMRYGLIYAVVGALASITICEFIEAVMLCIWYCMDTRNLPCEKLFDYKEDTVRFIKASAPITLSSLIFPIIAFADSILIVQLLSMTNLSVSLSTSQYGILTGPINSLINLPVVISLALSIAIVPKVSSLLAHLDVEHIKAKTSLCIQASFMICLPSFLGIFALSKPIFTTLYPTITGENLNLAIFLMQIQSISVVFLSQLEIFSAVLQGLNKSSAVLVNVAIGGIVKLIIEILTIPYIGIVGACIGTIAFFFISWLLNLRIYLNQVGKNAKLFQNVSKILLSGVIMAMAVITCNTFVANKYIALSVGVVVGIGVYLGMLILLKVVDKNTLDYLPFFKKHKKDATND